MSEAETERLLDMSLDYYWAQAASVNPGVDRPEVQLVRLVDRDEFDQVQVDCLDELGFEASVAPSGGIDYTVLSPEHESAIQLAIYRCAAMYPLDPVFEVPLNPEELRYIYEYWTSDLTECLQEQGVEVDPPPSVETFIDSYQEGGGWDPYRADLDSTSLSQSQFDSLVTTCPQYPAGLRGSSG